MKYPMYEKQFLASRPVKFGIWQGLPFFINPFANEPQTLICLIDGRAYLTPFDQFPKIEAFRMWVDDAMFEIPSFIL